MSGNGFNFGKKTVPVQIAAAEYTPPDSLKYVQPVNEPTPDWEDVRQQYPEHSTVVEVPVSVDKPIKAWVLPAKRGYQRTITVDLIANISQPVEIVPASPKIRRAWISVSGASVVIGEMEQVMDPQGADGFTFYGITAPVPFEGFEKPLYGVVAVGGTKQTVSVRYEFWAD
jgi:hypothetical protein